MPFDFASAKALARRTVHETLGVRALYEDDTVTPAVEVRARWHNKIDRFGDLDNQSYAELIQGIDRIIFDSVVARATGMKRGGTVTFPDYGSIAFKLMVREPGSGPVIEAWEVARVDA